MANMACYQTAPPSRETFPDTAQVFLLGPLLWVRACDRSDQANSVIE